MNPIRIQRKRTKGYNMQADSRARNGLDCVYVGRPSKWGNPFKIERSAGCSGFTVCGERFTTRGKAAEYATWLYECLMKSYAMEITLETRAAVKDWSWPRPEEIAQLQGKNLACFCPEGQACHADVLLELANEATP